MKNNGTLWQVFIAILLAVCIGSITTTETAFLGVPLFKLFGFIGQLFLNALMLVVVPLVCSSIIIGIARMGADSSFKLLGLRSFSYFAGTTFLSIVVAYVLMISLEPGLDQEGGIARAFVEIEQLTEMQNQAQQGPFEKIEQLFFSLIPTNIIAAASQGQMLGMIAFCMLFGFYIVRIQAQAASVILAFFQGIFEIMMKMTHLVMKALPLGVFALVAKVVSSTGMESITSVAAFFGVVVLGLLVTFLVIFPLILKFVARVSPWNHMKAMAPALVTAFTTSSSAATMPVTIDCLENRAGVSPRICGFVIPLGTAVNMPGTALYVCASVFFIAQAYGISLSWSTQAIVLLATLITSYGIAAVPSSSLITVVTVLVIVDLPAEGVALVLAIEQLLDMCRTAVNVFANSCCAVLVSKTEDSREPVSQLSTID